MRLSKNDSNGITEDMVIHPTVYVGLSLVPSEEAIRLKADMSAAFDLIPRSEMHITLGYLRAVAAKDIRALGDKLEAVDAFRCHSVQINGIGGAVQEPDERLTLLGGLERESWLDKPRVIWWSVETTDEMLAFRRALLAEVEDLDLESTYLRMQFFPHVTLGSNGPALPGVDRAVWDVHTVRKVASIPGIRVPSVIGIDRLHITNIPMKAASLHIVKKWNLE